MEIQTTIKDFSQAMTHLQISPDTPIVVIVKETDFLSQRNPSPEKDSVKPQYLPFLEDAEIWKGNAPHDLALNHDQYLYGED